MTIAETYDAPMNSSTTLATMTLEERVDVLKALADPYRLEILEILSPEIRCNCHLQDRMDIAPNLLSYHLKILREVGLIEGIKRGRWIDYAITAQAAEVIAAALPERLLP